ncbi:hypothetical protein SEEE4941_08404, partial [Salmonella enterica subsp. enterica serovar Enteritidis str. CVM_69-4941]|uniref:IbrB-like domain-containing protein n=1 Tax=Salmonella enterica TaxID=28901 RepID=UPI0002A6DF0F
TVGACSPARFVRWQQTPQGLESRLNDVLIDRYQDGENAGYPTLCKGRYLVDGPNDYNPNNVAPPEKKLLLKSIEQDGFTQPIVVVKANTEEYEIVDGFHRHELGKGKAALKRRLKGYLPITCLDRERHERMAATIRHNRARGRHQIHAMSEIVRELSLLGWDESKIGQELGMDADEVLRLKQINGLQELFADRRFSRAWTVK